jgi:hypothetical protein
MYSCSLSGSEYRPTEVAPRLLARREQSPIGLYYHPYKILPSNEPSIRCRPKIFDCPLPITLSDFRASDRHHPRRFVPSTDLERPGRRPRRGVLLSLLPSKPKNLVAWLRIGAMPLTRAYLKHLDVPSVAGGLGRFLWLVPSARSCAVGS